MTPPFAECRRILARHSQSFALAGRLLSRRHRDRLAAVYAWCREADDAIDLAPASEHAAALRRLEDELASIYAGAPQARPAAQAFQAVVQECGIPIQHPRELVAGLAMDARGVRYATIAELRVYAFRVAGTVALMACRVLGVSHRLSLVQAAHLGMAMQLTNICRDVGEDWERGRCYVPEELAAPRVWQLLERSRGGTLPAAAAAGLASAVARLLGEAERYYRSGERGLRALDPRTRVAMRTAAAVYAAIGDVVAARGCDVTAPRAVVSTPKKLALAFGALWGRPRRRATPWKLLTRTTVRRPRLVVVRALAAAALLAAPIAARAVDAPLAPGTYALTIRYRTLARFPVVGELASTYRSLSLATIAVGDAGVVTQTHRVCRTQTDSRIPFGGLDMPASFLAALGTHRYPLALDADDAGWRYHADLGVEYVGWAPATPDAPLPSAPDDPGVFDWDGDGKPGGTVRLRLPIAPDAELYVVQRGHALLDGRVTARDRVEGTVAVPVFEQHVIGATPGFLHRTPEIRPDTSASRFVLTRLPDASDCDAVVALGDDA